MSVLVRWMGGGCICLALVGCGTPRPSLLDRCVRDDADAARAAYAEGQLGKAAELYTRALSRARLIDDQQEVGRNAYNLALCRLAGGQPAEARVLLQQARLSLGSTGPLAGQTYLAESEAARIQGGPAEAGALAVTALRNRLAPDGVVQARLLLAETAAETNDLERAHTHYGKALSGVTRSTPASLRARVDGLAVRLIRGGYIEGDAAAHLYDRARWLKASGQFGEMAGALIEAGEAFSVSGRPEQAFDCWLRAAQSQAASGASGAARQTAARAADAAQRVADPGYAERARILVEELK